MKLIDINGKLYADTAALSPLQKLGTMVHVGFGDFEMSTPVGDVYFARQFSSEPIIPDQDGRAHLVTGPQEALDLLVKEAASWN